jgi:hypothetical protein
VPELEYALLCEHVRLEYGLAYITAANIDTLAVNEVPAAWNLGLVIALRFNEGEAHEPTPVEIVLRNESGENLAQIEAVTGPRERPPDLPEGWQLRALLGLNIGIVMPAFGLYSFQIRLGGETRQTLDVRVVRPQVQADAST